MTTEQTFQEGQTVRINYTDQYGHDRTESAEVVRSDDDTVTATFMAYGNDEYVTVPHANAEVLVARVTFGWSNYDDYTSMMDALVAAAKLATTPMKDPSCRRVSIIDLSAERGKHGTFHTALSVERPAA